MRDIKYLGDMGLLIPNHTSQPSSDAPPAWALPPLCAMALSPNRNFLNLEGPLGAEVAHG